MQGNGLMNDASKPVGAEGSGELLKPLLKIPGTVGRSSERERKIGGR